MEDYDLVKRLRKHGPPAIIPHALHTSGRRWQTVGFFRTMLTNQVGVTHHPSWLSQLYGLPRSLLCGVNTQLLRLPCDFSMDSTHTQ